MAHISWRKGPKGSRPTHLSWKTGASDFPMRKYPGQTESGQRKSQMTNRSRKVKVTLPERA